MLRKITFTKGSQSFAFRYDSGQEHRIVSHLMELANDPESNLDWLDAAMLSFQVARNAAESCRLTMTALGE